jgi:amidase
MGSRAHGGPARADAEVVRRLREAGAVIIGKTTCSELVAQPFTETAAWGTTHNPWDLDRTPGGSSGGSAAAVAGGLVGGALGSDGGGSIRAPASCCGLFGLKVQRDRIPLAPLREFWHGLAVYGPIVRHVRDAALFLDATADGRGAEPFAAAAARPPGRLRIALSYKVPPAMTALLARLDAEVRGAIEETASVLRRLGHEVVERDPDYGLVSNDFTTRYLRGVRDDARRMERPRFLERRTKRLARLGGLVPAASLAHVRAAEPKTVARINAIFDDCDVVLSPVMPVPPLEVGRYEGAGMLRTLFGAAAFVAYCPAWNAVGNPAASVPAGLTASGLPIGAQLAGRPRDEATLLSLSAQLEAERPWADRRPPNS